MKKGTWPKPSMALMELLDQHVSVFVTEKKIMFGAPCYFVQGNMFTGIFSDVLFARFSVQDRAHIDERGIGTVFEPVQGRKMTEYRALSKKVLDDPQALDEWLERSYSYVSTLEPKKKN